MVLETRKYKKKIEQIGGKITIQLIKKHLY